MILVRDGGFGGGTCLQNGPARVTVAMVRAEAVRLVPTAAVGLAPHGSSLVNIETVMWAAAPPHQTLPPVTLLGQRVEITLTLSTVAWDFGDGHSDPTGPPGKAYEQTRDPCRSRTCADYYGHIYRHTGRMTITARANWTASFTVDGGQPTTIPGTVPGPTAHATLTVNQARAVLVPDPDDRP